MTSIRGLSEWISNAKSTKHLTKTNVDIVDSTRPMMKFD